MTPPGDDSREIPITAGSVSVADGTSPRRTSTLTLTSTPAQFDSLITPGANVKITHGIDFGGASELVPMFSGGLVDGSQSFGDGTVSCTLADDGAWLARTNFLSPYSPPPTMRRVDVIRAIVLDSKPNTLVVDISTDTGKVGNVVWDTDRVAAIKDLCRDGGTVARFDGDGTFTIRDAPSTTDQSVWTIAAGDGGTMKAATRKRTQDRMYNTVVVRPSASDGSQFWTQQIAQVTDPTHPRHPSKVGVIPYTWASPTIATGPEALAAAFRLLDRVLGTTETLSIGAVANPALDGGDVIRAITPKINTQPAVIFQHFIDSLSFDLLTGDMTAATRSQEEFDG
ncbi:hypothetical protein [Glaciihabitans sp. dw_435]|uniref:hypothetical protein n=1 Tax=Glaciihabitans sp. dw_435 TaxID=2720081 RepID=UPI001BD57063|nr:hypothetical protein [Glaciihabitans sp. dw_435]